MEIESINSSKLVEIRKTGGNTELTFEKTTSKKKLHLFFEGFLFETPYPALNRKVERIEMRHVLGFKAITSLQSQHKNPSDYKQLLIQMDQTTDEHKIELICVFKTFQLT
jgi:hypothetical protein